MCATAVAGGGADALLVCRACGLRFEPIVDHATVRRVYGALARDGRAQAIEARRRPIYEAVFSLPEVPRTGRCLDVGCGAGTFLVVAGARSFQAVGVDRDAPADATGRVVRSEFPCPALRDDADFDLVTFLNSLNYFDDPVDVLGEACRLLRPGGVVVVRVPNDLVHRAAGAVVSGLTVAHPRSFTPRALRTVLLRAGFTDARILASAVTDGDPYATGILAVRALKRATSATALALARMSGHRWLWSPSLLAVARRPS